jgi:hypothetical protein
MLFLSDLNRKTRKPVIRAPKINPQNFALPDPSSVTNNFGDMNFE